jgi:hypothetical protein
LPTTQQHLKKGESEDNETLKREDETTGRKGRGVMTEFNCQRNTASDLIL